MIIKKEIPFGLLAGLVSFLLLFVVSSVFCSCASQARQAPQIDSMATYTCSSCGYKIDVNNINKNIRMKNTCPFCGKCFFYTPEMKTVANSNNSYDQRPKTYSPSSSYYSDTRYQRFGVGGYSFKETPTGFSELSWRFHDSRVKRHSVYPRWRTTQRYHYP